MYHLMHVYYLVECSWQGVLSPSPPLGGTGNQTDPWQWGVLGVALTPEDGDNSTFHIEWPLPPGMIGHGFTGLRLLSHVR